jgi:hypothetical protein
MTFKLHHQTQTQQQEQREATRTRRHSFPTLCIFGLLAVVVAWSLVTDYKMLRQFQSADESSLLFQTGITDSTDGSSSSNSSSSTTKVRGPGLVYSPSYSSASASSNSPPSGHLKIGLISGFVAATSTAKIKSTYLDQQITNQVCYADRWGYDYIFNTTFGFSEEQIVQDKAWWLNYGTWHRVPHMMAALPDYDWIVYLDNDYAFQSMNISLESFVNDWERRGLQNVSVFVPVDSNSFYSFSAFAVMVRNSPFGRRFLENWMAFARGLCRNGNLAAKPRKYTWTDSDQPGIWYSLAQTHAEFYNKTYDFPCNETTGLLQVTRFGGVNLNAYFKTMRESDRLILGFEDPELDRMRPGTCMYTSYLYIVCCVLLYHKFMMFCVVSSGYVVADATSRGARIIVIIFQVTF